MKNRIFRCSGRLAGAFAHRQRVVALHGPPIMSGGGNRLARYSALKFRRWRCAAKKCKQARARLADRQPRLRAAQVVVLQIGRGGRGRGHSEQVGKINAGRAPARAADGGPPPPILTPKRAYLKSERFYFPTLGHRPVSENKLFAFCVS